MAAAVSSRQSFKSEYFWKSEEVPEKEGIDQQLVELARSAEKEKIKRGYAENVLKTVFQSFVETKKELWEERIKRGYSEDLLSMLLKCAPKTEKKVEDIFQMGERFKGYAVETMMYGWEVHTQKDETERFSRNLQFIEHKLKKEGKLSEDDIAQVIEIDRFAEEHNLSELREWITKIFIYLEKTIPAQEVELKEGEIKELEENVLVRRRKDGVLELIVL